MNGTVALELEPSQISDQIGSDRVGQWDEDPSFAELVKDIKRRGQKQAIRVRPEDPNWRPDSENPIVSDSKFVIQSGRRRLQAVARLGQKVRAVISTDIGDAALADLEERFKENTMRKNLSGFEELVSIGLIAESYKDLSQDQIAERISVPQGDVSLGLSCVELFGEICALVDVETIPKREFRRIIPAIRSGRDPMAEPQKAPIAKAKQGDPKGAIEIKHGNRRAQVKAVSGGFTIKITGYTGSDSELSQVTQDFLEYLEKRES